MASVDVYKRQGLNEFAFFLEAGDQLLRCHDRGFLRRFIASQLVARDAGQGLSLIHILKVLALLPEPFLI